MNNSVIEVVIMQSKKEIFQQYCAAFYEEDEMFYLEEKNAVSK